jgi:CelD/BcsL family acetyltransferase involved in cellulose biosynthesis
VSFKPGIQAGTGAGPAGAGAESSTLEWRDGLEPVADEWDELAERVGAGPFQRPGWFAAWSRAFAGDASLAVLTARRAGRLVGAVPVLGRRGRVTSPTNWHTPSFDAVAEDGSVADDLARAVVARASTRLDFSFLDLDAPFAARARAAVEGAGRRTICRPVLRSPFVDLEGDFESYDGGLDTKFKRELTRRRRRLEELGELTIEFTDGRSELERQLAEGFAVEGSGWKVDRGTAIASRPETEAFYTDVARWAAERGWLDLGFLRLDGRAIAFAYLIVLVGVVHVVKVGFDPEQRKFAPGSLLTRAAIERAYERGMSRYDFLGAEDRYKLDWTDQVRERVRLQAFGSSPAGLGGYLTWRYGRPAIKRLLSRRRDRR